MRAPSHTRRMDGISKLLEELVKSKTAVLSESLRNDEKSGKEQEE